jgi:L-cysteine desulfidase
VEQREWTIKDILKIEVAPALGCTEPAAVALCTAAAAALLPERKSPQGIELWVDSNVYKNGLAVAIPGTSGEFGIDMAAALGAICGNPELKMEVFDPVDEAAILAARRMVAAGIILIHVVPDSRGIYIRCRIRSGKDVAEAVIERLHDNITSLKLNGSERVEIESIPGESEKKSELERLEGWLKERSLEELLDLCADMDEEDLSFIDQGLQTNLKLSRYGLAHGSGLGVGRTLERLAAEGLLSRDMELEARILTSAAADARMSGVKMPAMSSGGSGNHGLTAILPIWAVRDYLNVHDHQQVLKAIAFSHVITAYIKAFTGRLSAICGCSVAAGAGATAGITLLMGGTVSQISSAIKNLISDLAGVICDGAKNSCALKLATAAGTAVQAALFAMHGVDVKESDGIVASTSEQTMQNVGRLSVDGMIAADQTILQIMIDKQFKHSGSRDKKTSARME